MAGGGGSRTREVTGDLLTWWNQRRQIHRDLVTRARESEVIREQNKTCQFLRSHPCRPRSLTGSAVIMYRAMPSVTRAKVGERGLKIRDLAYRARGQYASITPRCRAHEPPDDGPFTRHPRDIRKRLPDASIVSVTILVSPSTVTATTVVVSQALVI